jgi:hypothetical protein
VLALLAACARQTTVTPSPATLTPSPEAAELYRAAKILPNDFLGKALEHYRLIIEQYSTSPQRLRRF